MQQTQQMGMVSSDQPEGVQRQQADAKASVQQQGHAEKPVQAGKTITDWASI
ncbi:hypothetical protein C8J30_101584 [Rhodobacter viridis]|uniref:Uncharacterized protein n=1 Tax=Rhodobacter viridis TaxID=1054202 RepID=A0A318U6J5_9RHOB|nr:hypothetical protein C8J30_101584 [Rhodobacter viridis]